MAAGLRRWVVTGSRGQIGTYLVEHLRQRYGSSNVFDVDIRGGASYEADATDVTSLGRIVDETKANSIVHLAAVLSASGEQDVGRTLRVNNGGTEAALEVARLKNLQVFVPSSIAVYNAQHATDESPTRPTTVYGVTKVYAELLGDYYATRYGVDFRSLRVPGVVSASPPGGGTTDWAVDIFRHAVTGTPYTCFLEQNSTLPFVYLDDLVRGIADFLEAPRDRLTRTTYNVAGFSIAPGDFATHIRHHIHDFLCDYEPDQRQLIADTWPKYIDDSLARRDWGWDPQYDAAATAHTMLQLVSHQEQQSGGMRFNRVAPATTESVAALSS